MKSILAFVLLFAVFVTVLTSEFEGEREVPEAVEYSARVARALRDCNNESCRASCILNGHNGGSCNSNDHCDCN